MGERMLRVPAFLSNSTWRRRRVKMPPREQVVKVAEPCREYEEYKEKDKERKNEK